MTKVQIKSRGNQSIECARMIASFFVVFIHYSFPDPLGGYINCLGRYAVPMFFVISGYFCFQNSNEKILAKMKSLLKLYLLAALAYLMWNIFRTEYNGGSTVAYLICAVPEIDEVARLIFLNVPPYVGHLWYLLAIITCYIVLWVYVRFFGEEKVDYRPLYLVSACLLVNQITTQTIWGRTAFLLGIPMFALGIFIRENQQRITSNFPMTTGKHLLVFLTCVLLSIIQWRGGVDSGCMEIGTILGTVVLMLFLIAHPVIAAPDSVAGRCISRFGSLSKLVYILHLMVMMAYELFLQQSMENALGENEPWLRPLVVLGISLLVAIVWDWVLSVCKKWFRK